MKMRLAILFVISAMLSMVLIACGDETAAVPTYSGATAVTLTDSTKSSITSSMGSQVKNPTVEGFKTSDDVNKIKSTYDSSFKSAGWDDKSSQFSSDASMQSFTSLGGAILAYQKGNKAAVVMVFPGSIAGPLGFSGLADSDNAIMVISGNQS